MSDLESDAWERDGDSEANEIAALQRKLDAEHERAEDWKARHAGAQEGIAKLLTERDALEAALRWYANEDNYRAVQRLLYVPAPAEEDRGRRARKALGIE